MSSIVEYWEDISEKSTKVRAVLKRSLAFKPGLYPSAFPYVEHWLSSEDNWKRAVYYLVAGLWALHRHEKHGQKQMLASACKALYLKNDKSESVERRFIALLDCDEGQLAHRMRQMVALLKEYQIDFDALIKDLLSWNHPDKWVQVKWAREFYKGIGEEETETIKETEDIK